MSSGRPNIIYVFADQWRRGAMGCMKDDPVITPVMDRFAEDSLLFTQAVSCTPLCSPHRASLMSGRYAMSTGVYTNCKLGEEIMLSPDEVCIGDVLKREGYATGYIGKWHLDLPEQNVEQEPASGARHWDAYTPPGSKRHGFDFWYSYGAYDQHLNPHYWTDSPDMIKVRQWSPEHETDVALQFLEERSRSKEQPFALFVSWNPPHSPYELVPERYRELYEELPLKLRPNVSALDPLQVHTGETVPGGAERLHRMTKDYYAAVSGLDEQFGRLLDGLRRHGFDDNTIVVLTSDHGELLGSHGLMAKHSWHEESIGIPFLIRWPERIAPGTTDELLNTVDIMPTLLSLCGLDVPDTVQGEDLSAAIRGNADSSGVVHAGRCERYAYISAFPGRKEAIDAYRAAGLDNRRYGWRGLRSRHYTYVVNKGYAPGDATERLLYDLERDPHQLEPLKLDRADAHPVADRMERELALRLKETDDEFTL
ncbi:sulfatase [Paenibacillus sp. J5C_2022]|uniref:sulfatase family protein n=1 Tax=Paenibacillus sp. J5C2022 TaxID=2977129 RepID=UPI0021D3C374|nr:sulfatase [Paenibacillus sp. J5C2022]MCU6712716.1 sulfatase [Paenibacillus sp. J5C2022]